MSSELTSNQAVESSLPGWRWYLLGLLTLNLLPIWLFPYFPSQDGPAHLHSATALRALASGDSFFQDYYLSQWTFATNQVYHLLLVSLGSFMPVLIAEKLILSLYVTALPLAMLFALRQLHTSNAQAVFLLFPVVYSFVMHMGFYNYCLGLVAFLIALGTYIRFTHAPTLSNSLTLSAAVIVTYFLHLVVSSSVILAIGSMAFARLVTAIRSRREQPQKEYKASRESIWKEAGLLALSVIPVIILSLYFLLTTANTAGEDGKNLLSAITRFLPNAVINPRPVQALTTFSMVDLAISLPWALLLIGLVGISLNTVIRKVGTDQYAFLGFAVIVFLILILIVPGSMGAINFLPGRFLPYFYFLLILWLATKPLSPIVWRHATVLAIIISVASLVYRLPIYAELNHDIAEFSSAARHIEDDSTVLPVILEDTIPSGLAEMRARARFKHIAPSAVGYVGLHCRIVNLRNYQAFRGYFPIRFRDEANPHKLLYGYGGEFEVDFDAYEEISGRPVDYVLLWGQGDNEESGRKINTLLSKIEHRYTLIHVSSRGLMRVYRANTHTLLDR